MDASTSRASRRGIPWRPWAAALFLAMVASALWDFLVKPGLTSFWATVLAVLTLGSQRIEDSVYAAAALDPSTTPVTMIAYVPLIGLMFVAASLLPDKWREKRLAGADAIYPRPTLRRKVFKWVAVVYVVFGGLLFTAMAARIETSIGVWKVFNANMRICAPYLTQRQNALFVARFTQMKTRSDFVSITWDLQQVADANGVQLICGCRKDGS